MAYRILAWFLRTVTRVFFRQVEVAGLEHVPKTGAVLFAGNHPNSLIDPILIEAETSIGNHCTIGPAVYVESGAAIGHGATVRESIVLRGARVPDGAHIVRQVVT